MTRITPPNQTARATFSPVPLIQGMARKGWNLYPFPEDWTFESVLERLPLTEEDICPPLFKSVRHGPALKLDDDRLYAVLPRVSRANYPAVVLAANEYLVLRSQSCRLEYKKDEDTHYFVVRGLFFSPDDGCLFLNKRKMMWTQQLDPASVVENISLLPPYIDTHPDFQDFYRRKKVERITPFTLQPQTRPTLTRPSGKVYDIETRRRID